MIIKLPIPIYHNNEVFCDEMEIKKPNAGCIADTKKIYDTGDQYGAIAFFISSCTESLTTSNGANEDKSVIKNMVRHMPYRSAEYVFTQIMLARHSDDGVEGVYYCPRCKTAVISEARKDPVSGEMLTDTRDFLHDLTVTFVSGLSNISYSLQEPIVIKSTMGQELASMESLVMRHPTLADSMAGVKRANNRDELRQQFGIYVEALVEVNGKEIDNQWRNNYGIMAFERMDIDTDLMEISKLVNQYGMDKRVPKVCPNCGKEWRAVLNTSNFFDLEALPM